MRNAVISGTTVVNVIEADEGFTLDGFTLIPTDKAGPGWTYHPGIGTFSPPEPEPEPIPETVSRRQARLALHHAGLLDDVEAAMSSLDIPDQIEWQDATEFRRDHPLIANLGTALGLSSDDIDNLFIQASQL